jgi:RNA polymerase sigma-70 factor (ECF subfamily)
MPPDEGSLPSSVVDLAVLGKLLEEHRPKLLAMVRRRLDPALAGRVDAEDVVNEAFFQARRRWGRFKEQSGLTAYAWLYRIVLDCLIEAWRRETRDCRDRRRDLPWPEASSVQLGLGLVNPGTSPARRRPGKTCATACSRRWSSSRKGTAKSCGCGTTTS